MNTNKYGYLIIVILITACSIESKDNPEKWSDDQLTEWFESLNWQGRNLVYPDSTVDIQQLAIRYHENKVLWEKAFDFLKNDDLTALEPGIHEISGTDVFAIVFEYDSKNNEDVQHETHKIYSDIHYVVSGVEYIQITDLSNTTPKVPYNEDNDIEFHNVGEGQHLLAEPGPFFIFHPGTVHGPGMKVDDNVPVKKIVIKVRN